MQIVDLRSRRRPLLLLISFFLVCDPLPPTPVASAAAQAPSTNSSGPNFTNTAGTVSPSVGILIGILFCAFVISSLLSIYLRWCTADNSTQYSYAGGGFIPIVLVDGGGSTATTSSAAKGVEKSVINRFPTFVYSAVKQLKAGKGPLECAVCLNEFLNEDLLRLLPKCSHVFHPQCIEAWLVGNTTCPVCRSNLVDPVASEEEETGAVEIRGREEEGDISRGRQNNGDGDDDVGDDVVVVVIDDDEKSRGHQREEDYNSRSRISRSNSTGHSVITIRSRQEQSEGFTLRMPDELTRKGKEVAVKGSRLTRAASLPRLSSSRRGYRAGGGGEGSVVDRSSWLIGRPDR